MHRESPLLTINHHICETVWLVPNRDYAMISVFDNFVSIWLAGEVVIVKEKFFALDINSGWNGVFWRIARNNFADPIFCRLRGDNAGQRQN
jgi:hypothetical protein